MADPTLFVIAGCNGSGKSSFSRLLVPVEITPFDYDHHYLQFYSSLRDSDIRETMAHNMAFAELEEQVQLAMTMQRSFCYENNFNSTPLFWPAQFKKKGYKLHLIYLSLNSIDEAIRRVAIRVENGGHFVPEDEIRKRYADGFANLNANFTYFDMVDLFDSSLYGQEPTHVLSIYNGKLEEKNVFPSYLSALLPAVAKLL